MQLTLKRIKNYYQYFSWSTYDLLITTGVGITIGVILTLLSTMALKTNNNLITIGNTTYEVVVEEFLGYEELMVVKRLDQRVNPDPAASLLETDAQGRYNGVIE